jgi:Tol biopolymer transport system component
MQLRKALLPRSLSLFLLAGMLLCAVGLPGTKGARALNLPKPLTPDAASHGPTADGRIAFAQAGEIYLINPDGSDLTQLTRSKAGVYNYQPALSPDGTRVAFGSFDGDKAGIYVVDVDGNGLRALTTNALSSDSEPAWSPDGSRIAFVRGYDPTADGIANFTFCGSEIYITSVDSGEGVASNLTQGQGGTDPAWSPDGGSIAFASNRDGNYEIYAIRIADGDLKRLTETAEHEAEPKWSPDGKHIAYARNYVHATFDCGFAHTGLGQTPLMNGPDIYLMLNDGTNQTRLTETENNFEPTWSPDGESLAFISFRSGCTEIYVMDPFHKTEFSISSDAIYKSSPSWSGVDPNLLLTPR